MAKKVKKPTDKEVHEKLKNDIKKIPKDKKPAKKKAMC